MAYASPSYQQQSRAVAQQSPHSQDSQSVERELWNIFTFYTLAGAATDPEHLRATQFVRFGRDVGLIGPNQVSEAEEPLLEADLHVAYTAGTYLLNAALRRIRVCTYKVSMQKSRGQTAPGCTE
eukprot:gb/GECG01012388.1/.p1 GENE.gb/GECG01012388.1/~~gb/GECG01012388.1/.p1  ORF type:complete len:124 (+),score=11.56 gb/GECG01012388.1/:1-372(+)